MNEFVVDFPGGARVDAHIGLHTIKTDQSPAGGGENSAPAPFSLFLASIGTCAGIYVLAFCRQRGLPTEGIRIVQRMENNPGSRMISKITLDIQLPPEFPEKYKDAVIRAADQCAVKKHMEMPPQFDVFTTIAAQEPSAGDNHHGVVTVTA